MGFQMSLMMTPSLSLGVAVFQIKTQLQLVLNVGGRAIMRISPEFLEADLWSQSLFTKEITQNRRFILDFLTRTWNTPNIIEELNC
jgi:hypothetical protein